MSGEGAQPDQRIRSVTIRGRRAFRVTLPEAGLQAIGSLCFFGGGTIVEPKCELLTPIVPLPCDNLFPGTIGYAGPAGETPSSISLLPATPCCLWHSSAVSRLPRPKRRETVQGMDFASG